MRLSDYYDANLKEITWLHNRLLKDIADKEKNGKTK